MKRVWVLLATLVAVALAACGSPAAPKATPQVETAEATAPAVPTPTKAALSGTVILWHPWETDREVASLHQVIAAFQRQHPQVQFEVLAVSSADLRERFEAAAATGTAPTLLIGAAPWGPLLYQAGLVADLSAEVDREFLNTLNPAALEASRYQGALVGLPQALQGTVLYRNRALMPTAPKTFDELVQLAQEKGRCAFLDRGFFFSAAHLLGLGGQLLDAQGNPAFNNEKGVEWIRLLLRFTEAGDTTFDTAEDLKQFKAGRACVILEGTGQRQDLAEAIGPEHLAIDPWVTPLSGFVQSENLYLSARAQGDERKAAVAFIKFFLSPEAQALLADPNHAAHLPAARGVALPDPLTQAAAVALEGGVPFPILPEIEAYEEPLSEALRAVFEQGADPAEALQQAYDAIVAKIQGERDK